ncbi:MAG TPA: DEAD/DEAH box helicase [Rhodanobacteraceae bacterium]
MAVFLSNDQFAIDFPYSPNAVAAVKALPGHRYDPPTHVWYVPANADTVAGVKAFAGRFGLEWKVDAAAFERLLAKPRLLAALATALDAPTSLVLPATVHATLRPYQRAGVAYMLAAGSALLADDMGLGKTLQTLTALEATGAYPALVICPASLVLNWRDEAARFLPARSVVALRSSSDKPGSGDIVIASYANARRRLSRDVTSLVRFRTIIADEAHYLKNAKSQRSKALLPLLQAAARCGHAYLLTGTPVTNRPADLIALLRALGVLDTVFGGWRNFVERYCDGHKEYAGASVGDVWNIAGASNLGELGDKLRATCMVRRLKADVLHDLPEKTRTLRRIDIDLKAYRAAETALLERLEAMSRDEFGSAKGRAEALVLLNGMRQAAGVGKVPAAIETVESYLSADRKVVVFAHHRAVLQAIADGARAAARAAGMVPTVAVVTLGGGTPLEERHERVDRFQRDPHCKVLVASTPAAGTGLTLTAASDCVVAEQEWTPAALDQAEDRLHRIGQADAVEAVHLLASGTVDEKIAELVASKRTVVAQVMEGGSAEAPAVPESVVNAVLGEYFERAHGKRRRKSGRKRKTAKASAAA